MPTNCVMTPTAIVQHAATLERNVQEHYLLGHPLTEEERQSLAEQISRERNRQPVSVTEWDRKKNEIQVWPY